MIVTDLFDTNVCDENLTNKKDQDEWDSDAPGRVFLIIACIKYSLMVTKTWNQACN